MSFIVKLPEEFEAKSSLAEYLEDVDNGGFNAACYEVLETYYEEKQFDGKTKERLNLDLFQRVYQAAYNIWNMRYREDWGVVFERGGRFYYILPDGTDLEKFGLPNLNLFMPMLYCLLRFVRVKKTEEDERKGFLDVKAPLCARIRLHFTEAPDEKAIFNMFEEKFGFSSAPKRRTLCPYTKEVVRLAMEQMKEPIGGVEAAWRGVVNALADLEREGLYVPINSRTRSNERLKYLSDDVAEYLGEEKAGFYNSIKSARGDYSQLSAAFKRLLEVERAKSPDC